MLNCTIPHTKTRLGGSNVCFTTVPHLRRPCRRRPFWEGVWDHFRAWDSIGAQGCVLLAPCRVQSAPRCAPRRPKVPKGTSKAHFWTSLGDPFGATLRKWRPCENLIIYHVFITKSHSGNGRCRTVDRVGHRVRSRIRFFVSLGGHRCAQASPKVAIGRPR